MLNTALGDALSHILSPFVDPLTPVQRADFLRSLAACFLFAAELLDPINEP